MRTAIKKKTQYIHLSVFFHLSPQSSHPWQQHTKNLTLFLTHVGGLKPYRGFSQLERRSCHKTRQSMLRKDANLFAIVATWPEKTREKRAVIFPLAQKVNNQNAQHRTELINARGRHAASWEVPNLARPYRGCLVLHFNQFSQPPFSQQKKQYGT